jgi:alpha-L-rhamnosidase
MVLGLIPGGVSAQMTTEKISISELKVNNLVEPLGIDTTPRFRWLNSSDGFGKYQSAYRIIVSSTEEKAKAQQGDLWDSGKVSGTDNFDIPYAGQTLEPRSLYYWSVRVWDEADQASAWSEVARFGTGIFDPADWKGSWIGSQDYAHFQLADFTLKGAN